MAEHPKLRSGQIVLTGLGQAMTDGSWSSCCVITEHHGPHTTDAKHSVPGSFDTEQEAISAGLHWGMKWVNATYPLPE